MPLCLPPSEHLNNVSVVVGETAVLACRVEGDARYHSPLSLTPDPSPPIPHPSPLTPHPRVVWKGPGGCILPPSPRLTLHRGEGGLASLTLTACRSPPSPPSSPHSSPSSPISPLHTPLPPLPSSPPPKGGGWRGVPLPAGGGGGECEHLLPAHSGPQPRPAGPAQGPGAVIVHHSIA